ncbi:MAG: NmrA family NAD(P)-binding protein [Sphingomonas sp.]|uniref:NmrA family NAD(P)-binding protein n=1 Tax=Sphingomonas sp. TaxID=28214 RepID=UPI0025E618F0|nr:NmrA family NAD(P)-binding protein [Sphingomonas sp.]MBX9882702.1 NmrA family NAD(P)-binding protein [Sphingomonas sp.]
MKPTILVTGATGKTGAAVAAQLLANGYPVQAMVRAQDARSAALARLGAKVVVADMYDPDQLLDALRGVQRAYYVPLMQPYMIQAAAAFAVAAREARIEAIVQMSQWTSHRAHPTAMTQQTWLVDRLFADLPGIAHVIFNPGMFADNFLRTIDFAALLGIYPMISGSGKAAPVSNEDMARTAAAILVEPERHAGMSLRPTGPELLDARQMAAIVAKAVGHSVMPINLPIWMLGKVAQQQGVNPYEISILRYYMEDMKRGTFAFEGGVTDVVERLTGTPAESFETTARRYAAMPFARQTFANRLKAFIKFNLTPFYPGYNFDKWDKRMGLPMPRHPSFSIEDERWRREHEAMMARQPQPVAAAERLRAV